MRGGWGWRWERYRERERERERRERERERVCVCMCVCARMRACVPVFVLVIKQAFPKSKHTKSVWAMTRMLRLCLSYKNAIYTNICAFVYMIDCHHT